MSSKTERIDANPLSNTTRVTPTRVYTENTEKPNVYRPCVGFVEFRPRVIIVYQTGVIIIV